jgi:hypothetical protein
MPTESVDQLIEQLKDLKVQESELFEKLSRARRQEREAQQKERTSSAKYAVGDRVRVTNNIKVPLGRSANTRDRTATVLYSKSVRDDTKVFIQTDNGFKTWRLEKNLSKIR